MKNLQSLGGVEYYLKEVQNNAQEDIMINIVGNKKDLLGDKSSTSEHEMEYLVKVASHNDRKLMEFTQRRQLCLARV